LPKTNKLLKYLRLDRLGRLTYERQIPLALRPYVGNKATIRRSLGVDGTDSSSPQVLTAYTQVHGEIQGVIDAAVAQHQHKSTAIQAQPQSFALAPRDVAEVILSVQAERTHPVVASSVPTVCWCRSEMAAHDSGPRGGHFAGMLVFGAIQR
jgi:hypothetical protein